MDGVENAHVEFVNPPIITLGDDLQGILGVNSFDSSIFTDLLLRKEESEDELEREIQRLLESPKIKDTLDIAEIIASDEKEDLPTEQSAHTDSSPEEQSTCTGFSTEEQSTLTDFSLEEQNTDADFSSKEQNIDFSSEEQNTNADFSSKEQNTLIESSTEEQNTRTDSSSPRKPSALAKEYELLARSILVSSPTLGIDGRKVFRCPLCPMGFLQRRYLRRHFTKHEDHPTYPQSAFTDSSSKEQSTPTESSTEEQNTRTDSSSPCKPSALAKEYESLARSILVTSPTFDIDGNTVFRCPLCPMTFLQRRYLNRHFLKHENRFTCPHCGKVFARKESKIKHIPRCQAIDPDCRKRKPRRPNMPVPTFSCDTCFRNFTRKENLDQHMLKHTGLRVLCDMCQRTFCSWKSFSLHKKLHEWTRTVYFCAHCSAMFLFKSNLQRHLQNVKNAIVCTECNLSVKSEKMLNRHQSQILKRCVICSQPFCLENHLRMHRKVLHPDMWFICKLCQEGTIFTALSEHNLRDHVRRAHKTALKFMECYEEGWYKLC